MNSGGGVQTNLTNTPDWDRSPAWSAGGGAIAFSRDPSGTPRHQIYRMNADGTGQTRVSTVDLWSYDKPSWSPDGTQIVAHANRDPGASQFDIVVMSADGTGETVLTADSAGPDVDPAWSPDGDRIAFSSRREPGNSMDIYLIGSNGSSPVAITSSPGSESQPNWSPDGQRIVFVSTECTIGLPCTSAIKVVNANGTGEVTLTSSNSMPDSSPAWSPDASKIVFQRSFPGNQAIHVMNADGTGEVQIGGNPAQDTDPDWQPLVTGYARPQTARRVYAPLAPAYAECAAPNRTHGPPLAFGSCNPPVQTSSNLTVGTPDAGGGAANSSGYFQITAKAGVPGPPDDSGAPIKLSLGDIRCGAALPTCGAANAAGGADYLGELQVEVNVRMTDKYNGSGNAEPGTVGDFTFRFNTAACAGTASTAEGASCTSNTDVLYVIPGVAKDSKRQIWELGQVRVLDGGRDGDADTPDNSLFAVSGLFIP